MRVIILLATLLVLAMVGSGQAGDPIQIDGLLDDWTSVPVAFSDPSGDGFDEDFAELRVTNDDRFLFFNIGFHHGEVLLQAQSSSGIYVYRLSTGPASVSKKLLLLR